MREREGKTIKTKKDNRWTKTWKIRGKGTREGETN